MNTLTEQVRHGAEQAWASLAEGWHDVRSRASGALTRFRRNVRPGSAEAGLERLAEGSWGLMAADVWVDADRVVVRLEAPGMSREDLRIDADRDVLCVSGEKRFEGGSREGAYQVVQCAYGQFRRELTLPHPVDAGRATATYRDGVLRIELPRLLRGEGGRIPVTGA